MQGSMRAYVSLDEVIKVGDLVCLDEGNGVLMEGFEACSSGRA